MSAHLALKQFNENLRLFANPQAAPEKYNLYAGLGNLAESLRVIEQRTEEILRTVRDIDARNR